MARDDGEQDDAGRRLRRVALSALGWGFTAIAVLVILVVVGGGIIPSWMLAVAVAIGLAIPVLAAVVYLRVRTTASPQGRVTRNSVARLLERVDGDDALGLRRTVLADRVELSAGALADIPEPADRLAFVWAVRPSQRSDYPRSPQFAGLSPDDQDAVVLLDFHREVELRGVAVAFSDGDGFYHHGFERVLLAASRTNHRALIDAVLDARRAPADGAQLVALLGADETWTRYLATG